MRKLLSDRLFEMCWILFDGAHVEYDHIFTTMEDLLDILVDPDEDVVNPNGQTVTRSSIIYRAIKRYDEESEVICDEAY